MSGVLDEKFTKLDEKIVQNARSINETDSSQFVFFLSFQVCKTLYGVNNKFAFDVTSHLAVHYTHYNPAWKAKQFVF